MAKGSLDACNKHDSAPSGSATASNTRHSGRTVRQLRAQKHRAHLSAKGPKGSLQVNSGSVAHRLSNCYSTVLLLRTKETLWRPFCFKFQRYVAQLNPAALSRGSCTTFRSLQRTRLIMHWANLSSPSRTYAADSSCSGARNLNTTTTTAPFQHSAAL